MPASRALRSRTLVAFLLIAAAVVVALPAAAHAAAASARVSASASSVRDYWSKQRMRAAEPVDAALGGGTPPASRGAGRPAQAAASYVPPAQAGEPANAALVPGSVDGSDRVLGLGVVRDEIVDPSAIDSRTHGKIFFTIPQGSAAGDYMCSGTVVNSRVKSVVWTAGHCVYDLESGGFATNWIVVPGYKDGVEPFGEWPAKQLATTTGWKTSANLRYDLGAAVVRKNANGRRLQAIVGARGIGFDQPRDQLYSAYGYPAEAPPLEFTGEREFRCMSKPAGTDQPVGSGPSTMSINCDMTAGSSGGGWIAGATLLSVTSYGYLIEPDHLYGPYMSASAKELYKSVRGKRKKKHPGGKG